MGSGTPWVNLVLIGSVALGGAVACNNQTPTRASEVVSDSPSTQVTPSAGQTAATSAVAWSCVAGRTASSSECLDRSAPRAHAEAVAGAPNAPTGLVAAVTLNNVSLTWLAPGSGPALTTFVIEAGPAPGAAPIAFATGSTLTAFATSGVPPGTYYIRIRARNAVGDSDPSNEVVVTINPAGGSLTFTAPQRLPNGRVGVPYLYSFCVPAVPNESASLCQAPPATNPAGGQPPYHFQLGTAGGFAPFGLSLELNGLLRGTPSAAGDRTFTVDAVDLAGHFVSQTVTITIEPAGPTGGCTGPPAVPTAVSATANGTTVTVSWNKPAGATSFVLEAGTGLGLTNLYNEDVGDIGLLQAPGVAAGRYYLRVRARNACGTSAPSSEAIVNVGSTSPPPTGGSGYFEGDIVNGTGYGIQFFNIRQPVSDIYGSATVQRGILSYRFSYNVQASTFTVAITQTQPDDCLLALNVQGTAPVNPGQTFIYLARGTLTGTYTYAAACRSSNQPPTSPVTGTFVIGAKR